MTDSLDDIPPAAFGDLGRAGQRIYRQMSRTIDKYGLLSRDDHVLVALSGGKDSYTMVEMLTRYQHRLPGLRLTVVHLDQQQPGYDGRPLRDWLRTHAVDFEILSEDTYSVVREHVAEGGTYCSMCSRLRRGVLYTAAERLGCTKVALGHHRDDTLETFLMNLMFSGRLQAMPATYTTDDGRFDVIRPLIDVEEAIIAEFASGRDYAIIPCTLCGSQSEARRVETKALIASLADRYDNLRAVMAAALGNVSPTHLLDVELAQRGIQRRAPPSPSPPGRFAAEPIASRRLPVVS